MLATRVTASVHARAARSRSLVRRLAPGIETIQALLIFTDCAQVLPVHVNAISAAIDLRSPQLDEVQKRNLKSALVKVSFESEHGVISPGGNFKAVNSRLHFCPPG